MIDEFANRQAMHLTVVNLLDDPVHTPVWENQAPTMFTTRSLLLREKVNALTFTIAQQEAALTGRAEQKEREETELETIAHEIGQVFATYLIDEGREAEAAEIDLSLSAWRRLRDTALLAKAMDSLVLRFRSSPEGIAFADNWTTARVVRDLGANNPEPPAEPEPPAP